ncbi:MAG: DsrE family protein [Planctomycetota bacterium]
MQNDQQATLQVIITSGPEDPDKALFGLQLALVSISSGTPTRVFLTLRASQWACARSLSGAGASEVYLALEGLVAAGAEVGACSACLHKHCSVDSEDSSTLRAGIRPAGLMSVVHKTMSGAKTLTF